MNRYRRIASTTAAATAATMQTAMSGSATCCEYRMNEVLRQLEVAGYRNHLSWEQCDDDSLEAWAIGALIPDLRKDTRFQEGLLFGLHRNIGKHLTDFRGFRGAFGKGSLQIVVDKKTGRCYADVDGWSPYADLIGAVMHMGEVVKHLWRKRAEHPRNP